jgi:transcriptional regulator with XRE-family HTH domain
LADREASVEKERVAGSPFGTLLRRHRLAAGLSQEVLAEQARMSINGIGALERGDRRYPYRETVVLLAKALGLAPLFWRLL